MTKTNENITKLVELRDKAHEILNGNTVKIAHALKSEFQKETDKIKRSDMMPGERAYRMEQLPQKLAVDMLKFAAEQKAEYKKLQGEARKLAQTLKLTESEKPSDELEVKAFERDLDQLIIATALAQNAERSIMAVDSFLTKYDNPYYAEQLNGKFTQIMTNTLSIDGTPQTRQKLSKLHERIQSKATTEEQRIADEILSFFASDEPKMYREGTTVYNAISGIIGSKAAANLNKADEVLEQMKEAEKKAE